MRIRTDWSDQSYSDSTDSRYGLFDLGVRFALHGTEGAGPFGGIGVGEDFVRASGLGSGCRCENNFCNPCDPIYRDKPYTKWSDAPIFELDGGATLPKVGPVAPELFALLGIGTNPDEPSYDMTTVRIALGGRSESRVSACSPRRRGDPLR